MHHVQISFTPVQKITGLSKSVLQRQKTNPLCIYKCTIVYVLLRQKTVFTPHFLRAYLGTHHGNLFKLQGGLFYSAGVNGETALAITVKN